MEQRSRLLGALAILLAAAPGAGQEHPPVLAEGPPSSPPLQPAPPAPGDAPSGDGRVQEALDRIAKQEQELARLRGEMARDRARAEAERAADHVALEAARHAREPSLGTARLGLNVTGFVQVDFTPWRQSSLDELNPSTGDPLNEERFELRRARLRVSADYGILGGALEFDANTIKGTTVRVVGAEVSLKWPPTRGKQPPLAMLTIGLFKVPFGFEVAQGDTERLFLDRSISEHAFFPGEYDLGLRLSGGWRFLRYALAYMNGEPIGEKGFPLRDPNGAKDFVGRVGLDTAVWGPISVAGGVSGLYGSGFHPGTPAGKDVLTWRDMNQNGIVDPGELQVANGVAATPSANFDRFALGADLRVMIQLPRLGELLLYGELTWAENLDRGVQPADPVAASRDLRELGYYVGGTLELSRRAQIGVRYDYYNPDGDSTDRQKGVVVPYSQSQSTWAFAAALRLPPVGRLVLEYDHNKNHFGRDANGVPQNLDDDFVTLRGEVLF